MTTFYSNNHPFVGTGDQCKYIVNDYVGECGCSRESEVHGIAPKEVHSK